jgi:membrane protein
MRGAAEAVRRALGMIGRAAWDAFVRFYGGHDMTYAASIAYWALLSLFPFLLLVLSIVGALVADNSDRTALVTFVRNYLPARVGFITGQIDAFRETRVQIGVVGLFGLLWASLGFFNTVTTAVNYAWGVETPRSFLRHRLFAFLMLLTAGALFLVAVVLTSAAPILGASWFAQLLLRFPGLSRLQGIGARLVSMLLLIVVLGFVYYFVPNVKVRFRSVWPGAVLTGVVWRLVFAAFSWYLGDVSRLNRIHGSLATVVVFLLWIYVSANVMLYGVQFTAAFHRLSSQPDAERV